MKTTLTSMAGHMATAAMSRGRASTCSTSWYGTAIQGANVAVFTDHKLPPVRPKESP